MALSRCVKYPVFKEKNNLSPGPIRHMEKDIKLMPHSVVDKSVNSPLYLVATKNIRLQPS